MQMPKSVATFLQGRRIAVAGVSRNASQPANAIFRRLRTAGYEVFPINPKAAEVEGVQCYKDVGSVPAPLDGIMIVTPPDVSIDVVRQSIDAGVRRVWFHRSIGDGSVSAEAIRSCEAAGVECIAGGCPLMFCEPVDIAHRCMRWWFQKQGRVPK